jgi:hypothetical protein
MKALMNGLQPNNSGINRRCSHTRARIYRRPFADGTSGHLIELCEDCSVNVRGPGRWVPRREVVSRGLDPDTLPLVPSRKNAPHQPSLFEMGGLT